MCELVADTSEHKLLVLLSFKHVFTCPIVIREHRVPTKTILGACGATATLGDDSSVPFPWDSGDGLLPSNFTGEQCAISRCLWYATDSTGL